MEGFLGSGLEIYYGRFVNGYFRGAGFLLVLLFLFL